MWPRGVWTSARLWTACWETALLQPGFHWGGGKKHTHHIINKMLSLNSQLKGCLFRAAAITTPSPPGRGRCSQRKGPRVRTEPAQWCECCGQRNWQTPPSEGSEVFPPLSARGGALKGEASSMKGSLLLIVAVVHIQFNAQSFLQVRSIVRS